MFKEMAYSELIKLGYPGHIRPSRKGKERAVPCAPSADHMAILKNTLAYQKAAKRLDDADRALNDALEAGKTWDNTEVPPEYTWQNENLKDYVNSLDNYSTVKQSTEEDILQDDNPIMEEQRRQYAKEKSESESQHLKKIGASGRSPGKL